MEQKTIEIPPIYNSFGVDILDYDTAKKLLTDPKFDIYYQVLYAIEQCYVYNVEYRGYWDINSDKATKCLELLDLACAKYEASQNYKLKTHEIPFSCPRSPALENVERVLKKYSISYTIQNKHFLDK